MLNLCRLLPNTIELKVVGNNNCTLFLLYEEVKIVLLVQLLKTVIYTAVTRFK